MIFLVTNSWNLFLNTAHEIEFNKDVIEYSGLTFYYTFDTDLSFDDNLNWMSRFTNKFKNIDFSKVDLNIYIHTAEQLKYFKENFETCSILIYYKNIEDTCKEEFKNCLRDFDHVCAVSSTCSFYQLNFRKLTGQN